MISDKMVGLVNNSSVIRAMFEEGKRLANIYGPENVYDFSLGNPNVAAPKAVNEAIKAVVDEEESVAIHGYMSNSGYEDVTLRLASSRNALSCSAAPSAFPYAPPSVAHRHRWDW